MFPKRNMSGGWRTKKTILPSEQGAFLRRLGELKSQGYPLDRAMEFLLLHQENLSSLHHEVLKDFLNGHTLSDTLKKLGFPSFVCLHLYFAERYGDVEKTLLDTSVLIDHRQREIKNLIKLLHYPMFLILLFVGILIVLNLYLLPRFTALYSSLGQSSDGLVSILSTLFKQLPFLFLFLACILTFLLLVFFFYLRGMEPHDKWSFLSSIPILGYYVQHYHSYVFSREASYLMKGGMSIQSMLETFIAQPYRGIYHDMGKFISDELNRGQSMHQTLLQLPYITDELKRITQHGEDNGELEAEWRFYSQYCLTSLESRTEKLFAYIQPCLFLLLGIAIISAYLIILLPIFQIMKTM
ncbi:competence type IV pilus assembly protein ComGB [Jeotgalibacillus sp. S-D1]|uniref:competence type IV pilus assembly protein ComGB n=1 Tax=Jeotgalibacillus sp. S-D1 TaxID=2552189 RepID=UPI001F0ED1C5|nr:competence type IV pilus assembly protein ComGB [Jeotgalibacillus sp. S-D1]